MLVAGLTCWVQVLKIFQDLVPSEAEGRPLQHVCMLVVYGPSPCRALVSLALLVDHPMVHESGALRRVSET